MAKKLDLDKNYLKT